MTKDEKRQRYLSQRGEKVEYQRDYNATNREDIAKKEAERKRIKREAVTREQRFINFKRDIIDGPNFTCHSCNRQLFKKQVKTFNSTNIHDVMLKHNLEESFLLDLGLNITSDIILCHTCLRMIKNNKVPGINVANGLKLDYVPEELKLKDLEQQLIARSLLFLKIQKLPKTRMKANVDNVRRLFDM